MGNSKNSFMKVMNYSVLIVKSILLLSCLILFMHSCMNDNEKDNIILSKDLYISKKAFELNNFNKSSTIQIQNNIDFEFELTLSYDTSLISVSQDTLFLNGYVKKELIVQAKMNNLAQDSTATKVYFLHSNSIIDTLDVSIIDYAYNTFYFSQDIIEAEYCKLLDKIVLISENPHKALYTFDIDSKKWDCIYFEKTPTCLSVSPTKSTAAVGFDKEVLYIDLENLGTIHEYSIDDKCFDIILTSGNWIYVFPFPQVDAYVRITYYSINSENNLIQKTEDISNISATRVRLQPGEKFIYGVWESVYSSEVTYKYNISNDVLEVIGSNSHSYDLNHDFWFSCDGSSMYARSGKVFSSESDTQLQLVQKGMIVNVHEIIWLEHNPIKNKIYLIDRYLRNWYDDYFSTDFICYGANDLSFPGKIGFNKFTRLDSNGDVEFYDALLRYVFFDSNYSGYFVIAQVIEGSGLVNDWLIQRIDEN